MSSTETAAVDPCLCGRSNEADPAEHGVGCPMRFLRQVGYLLPNDPTIWTGTNSFTKGKDTPVYVVVWEVDDDLDAERREVEEYVFGARRNAEFDAELRVTMEAIRAAEQVADPPSWGDDFTDEERAAVEAFLRREQAEKHPEVEPCPSCGLRYGIYPLSKCRDHHHPWNRSKAIGGLLVTVPDIGPRPPTCREGTCCLCPSGPCLGRARVPELCHLDPSHIAKPTPNVGYGAAANVLAESPDDSPRSARPQDQGGAS